jgi:hypothetical protein
MSDPGQAARDMIQRQIKALDAISSQTLEDLNTVAGTERIAKWKTRTVPLLAQWVGKKEAQEFADTRPGPSFTNDIVEEFTDEVDLYRNYLVALSKKVGATLPPVG